MKAVLPLISILMACCLLCGQSQTTSTTNSTNQTYTPLNTSVVETNETIRGAMNYGVQEVLKNGVNDSKIPDTPFSVATINSIGERIASNPFYRFDLILNNNEGTTVNTTFVVEVLRSGRYALRSWSYRVTTRSNGTALEEFQNVDVDQISTNERMQRALDYGVERVVEIGIANNKIPRDNYRLVSVQDAAQQRSVNGRNYAFNAIISNTGRSVNITSSFTVFSNRDLIEYRLLSYSSRYTVRRS